METKNNTNANKSRKAIRIVISILVAIALWVYVDRGLSVEVTMKVKNVPVEFSGEDTTLADKNLMLLSGYDTTIDLVLKGPRSELRKLDKSKVRIVADTSSIQETGQQTLSYQVYFQDDIQRSKISVDHASAYSVTVTVGEMDSKTVPIRCDIVGSTAKGFTAGGADPGPGGAESAGSAGRPAEHRLCQGDAGHLRGGSHRGEGPGVGAVRLQRHQDR